MYGHLEAPIDPVLHAMHGCMCAACRIFPLHGPACLCVACVQRDSGPSRLKAPTACSCGETQIHEARDPNDGHSTGKYICLSCGAAVKDSRKDRKPGGQ